MPYSLPARMISGVPSALVTHSRVEDAHLLPVRQMQRHTPLGAGHQKIAQADVGEGAAHHHFVVAAPRTILIEIRWLHALLHEVFSRRAATRDVAGRRDVIRGHRITEQCQHASRADRGDRGRLHAHALEVGRILHIGGAAVPGVELARREPECPASAHRREDAAVAAAEHLGIQVVLHRIGHLGRRRPDVPQEDGFAIRPVAERARRSYRCPACPRSRRQPPAVGRRGSSCALPGARVPRNCGCRTAPSNQ